MRIRTESEGERDRKFLSVTSWRSSVQEISFTTSVLWTVTLHTHAHDIFYSVSKDAEMN